MNKILASALVALLLLSFAAGLVGVWQIKPVYATTAIFGSQTTSTAYEEWTNGTIRFGNGTPSSSGSITQLTAHIYANYAAAAIAAKMALYKVSDNSLVANSVTDERTWANAIAVGFYNFTYSGTAPVVVSGTAYNIAIWSNRTSQPVKLYGDAGGTSAYQSLAYGTFPNPSTPSAGTRLYGMYATYTVSESSTLPEADYYIFKSGANYIMSNETDGTPVLVSNTDADYVIDSAQGNMTSGDVLVIACDMTLNSDVEISVNGITVNWWNSTVTKTDDGRIVNISSHDNIVLTNGSFTASATTSYGWRSYNSNNITFANASFTGIDGGNGVICQLGSGCLIQNNTFIDNPGETDCIVLQDMSDAYVANNYVTSNAEGGQGIGAFAVLDDIHNITIAHNICYNWSGSLNHGIYVGGVVAPVIYDNVVSSNVSGGGVAFLVKSPNSVIYNNTVHGGYNAAFHIYSESAPAEVKCYPNGTRIYNNDLYGAGTICFYLQYNDAPNGNISMHDNFMSGWSKGLIVEGSSGRPYYNVTFENNICSDTSVVVQLGDPDISDYADQIVISNNTISDSAGDVYPNAPIYVGNDVTNVQISNNAFTNCSSSIGLPIIHNLGVSTTIWNNTGLTGFNILNMSVVGGGSTVPDGLGWQYKASTNATVTWAPYGGNSRVDFSIDGANQTTTTSPINIGMSADHVGIAYFTGTLPPVVVTITLPTNTTYTTSTISVTLSASGGTINLIVWNCTFTNGTVVYANTVYTVPTSMTLGNGNYIFNALANNTDGDWDEETVMFSVAIVNHYYFSWNFKDRDNNNVNSILTYALYDGIIPVPYVKGVANLTAGTYTLVAFYYGYYVNDTALDTATQGNTTVNIPLEMKHHTIITNGYLVFDEAVTSLVINEQTHYNLTFTVTTTSTNIYIRVPANASFFTIDGTNRTYGGLWTYDDANGVILVDGGYTTYQIGLESWSAPNVSLTQFIIIVFLALGLLGFAPLILVALVLQKKIEPVPVILMITIMVITFAVLYLVVANLMNVV